MKFDVILPTYNGAKYLKDTVVSVMQQDYDNYLLTIIDDNSSDDTRSVINRLQERFPDRIFCIFLKEGKRAAGARMEAIKRTKGDIIAFIDQDDLWLPEKLRLYAEEFKNGFQVVHSHIEKINQNKKILHGYSDIENAQREEIFNTKKNKDSIKHLLCKRNYIRLTTAAVTRKAFMEVGGFDIDLFGGEDWDFWFRIAAYNNSIRCVSKKLTYRRVHDENTSKMYRVERNKGLLLSCEKNTKQFPELSVCLRKRRYIVRKHTLSYLISEKLFSEAREYAIEVWNQESCETIPLSKKIVFVLFGYSHYLGFLFLKTRTFLRHVYSRLFKLPDRLIRY